MTRQNKNWLTPLDVPAATSGDYAVEHQRCPAGMILSTASPRTAILGGDKTERIAFDEPTRWHRLVGPSGVWMTDLPIEQAQHDALLWPVSWGRTVLVGGLGLGLAATILARRKKVKKLIVVERSKDVIDLVWPYLLIDDPAARSKVEVVHADLFAYLAERKAREWEFDWAFFDIWQGDGVTTFFDTVVPLRRAAEGIVRDDRVLCWNENVMRGQLVMHLIGAVNAARLSMTQRFDPWTVPFWRWAQDVAHDYDRIEKMIATYCRTVGMAQHEALWASAVEDEARRAA